jgi:uncharacterized membrane protein
MVTSHGFARCIALGLALVAAGRSAGQPASFEVLFGAGMPQGLSADGSTVVGLVPGAAFRWTRGSGVQWLGPMIEATAVSADGSVVCGRTSVGAARWTAADGVVQLPGAGTRAHDISSDGSIIVGDNGTIGAWAPCVWRGGVLEVWPLPGSASAISGNGKTIVGVRGEHYAVQQIFRWTSETGVVNVGQLRYTATLASDVSSDGSVVIGYAQYAEGGVQAAYWTAATGMQPMGDRPGQRSTHPTAISGDGRTVVGYDITAAVIWTVADGWRELRQLLVEAGLDLTGRALLTAQDISPDGRHIVGTGTGPTGELEMWVARLPGPCAPDLNDDGRVSVLDLLRFLEFFADADRRVDFNRDGAVSGADLAAFLGMFGDGCPG